MFALTFTFYVSIFLYFLHQGFRNRDTIIGHINMYLVKKIDKKTDMFHTLRKSGRPFWGDLALVQVELVN